jgi:hypothetical protein
MPTFGKPKASSSDFQLADHLGDLVCVVNPSYTVVDTKYGVDTPAILAEALVVLEPAPVRAFEDVMLFGRAVVPSLRDAEPLTLAVVEQGEARSGQNPPWLLAEPSAEQEARAEALMTECIYTKPSGAVAVDLELLAQRANPPASDEPY